MITAVVCGRNDNYGGHLLESAAYSLNSMLRTFDEVIYVDWNTPDESKIVTDELELVNRDKLRVVEIRPTLAREILGDAPAQPMCEVLARNAGIRRAKGDIIVSTNIDIIAPPRAHLDVLCADLLPGEMITLAKQDVELDDLRKHFGENTDVQKHMPLVFGLWSLEKRLLQPRATMTRDTLLAYPERARHALASLICACGDFQIAHRDTWFEIKGFEEEMKKRLYADTTVQYQVLMNGGRVHATNFPPLYHIEHERLNVGSHINSERMNAVTTNGENWGLKEYDL